MAEVFEGFGIGEAIRNQPRAFAVGDFEFLLKRLPQSLLQQFSELAESGIFGEGGVEALLQSVNQQAGFQRAQLGRGLRSTLGRRLGPRSGGIDNLIANRVFAPSFAGAAQQRGNLFAQNQQSKLGGLQGIQDLLRFFQSQVGLQEELDVSRQGPGFLDFVQPLATIGGGIFGGPAGAAAGSAVGGGLNNPRGPV